MADPAAQQAMNVEPPTYNRVGWQNMTASSNPAWADLTPEKQEEKLATVKAGGDLADSKEVLPESRQWNDLCFFVVFLLLAIGMLVWATMHFDNVKIAWGLFKLSINDLPDDIPWDAIGLGGGCGTVTGLIGCFLFVYMLGCMPGCVVWGSLVMGPVLNLAIGGACIYVGMNNDEGGMLTIVGWVLVALSVCSLGCIFMCFAHLVPFTIEVADCLSDVIKENPSTVAISLVGGMYGVIWPGLVLMSWLATIPEIDPAYNQYVAIPFVFILYWGASIGYFYTHTILCGVFGRWYYKKDQASPMCSSICVASTTSLGSLSFAAFCVAVVRTIEFAIAQAKARARGEGAAVAMCVLMCLECIVACLADLLEWFSEWALVQVALRGTSFIDSARITLTMATASNLSNIITAVLINAVTNMATLLILALSAGAGFGSVYLMESEQPTRLRITLASIGLVMGLVPGIFIGNTAGSLIASGSKTILMSWAENPTRLSEVRPELALKFEKAASGFED